MVATIQWYQGSVSRGPGFFLTPNQMKVCPLDVVDEHPANHFDLTESIHRTALVGLVSNHHPRFRPLPVYPPFSYSIVSFHMLYRPCLQLRLLHWCRPRVLPYMSTHHLQLGPFSTGHVWEPGRFRSLHWHSESLIRCYDGGFTYACFVGTPSAEQQEGGYVWDVFDGYCVSRTYPVSYRGHWSTIRSSQSC